jgi:hypothetical protein
MAEFTVEITNADAIADLRLAVGQRLMGGPPMGSLDDVEPATDEQIEEWLKGECKSAVQGMLYQQGEREKSVALQAKLETDEWVEPIKIEEAEEVEEIEEK